MTINNIRADDGTGNEAVPAADSPRDHIIALSVTAEDFQFLERHASQLKETLGRRVVPIARAAYDVFRRGCDAMGETAA